MLVVLNMPKPYYDSSGNFDGWNYGHHVVVKRKKRIAKKMLVNGGGAYRIAMTLSEFRTAYATSKFLKMFINGKRLKDRAAAKYISKKYRDKYKPPLLDPNLFLANVQPMTEHVDVYFKFARHDRAVDEMTQKLDREILKGL